MKSTAASKGQSLAEYTLVGGLLALVSIGGLIALNTSVGQQFISMQGLFGGGGQQANAAQNNARQNEASGSPANSAVSANKPPTSISGYDLSIEGAQAFLASSSDSFIETSGASGYTDQLANYIAVVANEISQNPDITPEELGLIQDLSTQGKRMAQIQYLLEEAAWETNKDPSAFRNTTITFEGQTYTARDFSQLISFTPDTPDSDFFKFQHLAEQVGQSNHINPATKELVSELSESIKAVAHDAHLEFYGAADGWTGSTLSNVSLGAFSTPTQTDASHICSAGNGENTATACQ